MNTAEKYPNLTLLAKQLKATGKPAEILKMLKASASLVKKS